MDLPPDFDWQEWFRKYGSDPITEIDTPNYHYLCGMWWYIHGERFGQQERDPERVFDILMNETWRNTNPELKVFFVMGWEDVCDE